MARDDAPDSGPLWRGHLQQVRQHQGLLSHQRGQGDQGDRLHRDAQRGQSHHGGLCCLLCQQGQEGQGVDRVVGLEVKGGAEALRVLAFQVVSGMEELLEVVQEEGL